jgi:2,5-diamino-6-(ribosylamino)-4(3H)-pyrimidinone 5'-phosphate reductase
MKLPLVFLNAAISIDGKMATRAGDVNLSSEEDWKIVHNLRNEYQGLMIGGNTAKIDNPKLTIKKEYIENRKAINYPVRIIVDSKASLPSNAKCLTFMPEIKTIIGVSEKALASNIERLEGAGAIIIQTNGNHVNMRYFLEKIYREQGIQSIMVEGGGTLIWTLLNEKLIKKFRLYLAPFVAGGEKAISLVRGEGFKLLSDGPEISFTIAKKFGEGVVVEGEFNYK